MGHSRMYLLGEVLNSVWHVDFLKYYYFKFYVWKKKGTKSSKLGMAEYRETNVEYGKKKPQSWLFLWQKPSMFLAFFFFHIYAILGILRNASSGTCPRVMSLNHELTMMWSPFSCVFSASCCSLQFAFLAVKGPSFGSVDEVTLFSYLPVRWIASRNQV